MNYDDWMHLGWLLTELEHSGRNFVLKIGGQSINNSAVKLKTEYGWAKHLKETLYKHIKREELESKPIEFSIIMSTASKKVYHLSWQNRRYMFTGASSPQTFRTFNHETCVTIFKLVASDFGV